ncbi:MAG: matrixin family metalloprotease [Fimbriimonadaceae bacterium]|nr:matrixin family metalloprotease [Fimbriimonadaceae bacterium]
MNIHRTRSILCVAGALALAASGSAYSLLSMKWAPGANTAQDMSPNLGTPGGATWSVMGAGLGMQGAETHAGALTTSLGGLIGGSSTAEEIAAIGWAIDTWAAVCNFTNLGMVADGGVNGGASQASGGHLGDMRFAAIGGFSGGSVIAHAYTPGTEATVSWGTLGGDVHFNTAFGYVDNPNAGSGSIDFATIALHEIGHALGLGHSTVTGSVMEPVYAGARRSLHADDIAGIQRVYGTPVPEPASMAVLSVGVVTMMRRRRRSA